MKPFIHDDFLLETDVARDLYHRYVRHLPIIDYHCHLPVKQIADDHRFRSLTEIWLDGDHYKWRAMRADGVNEKYITGHASDWEKFQKWAEVTPHTLRNPLYHWTHLELQRYFGIGELLAEYNAARIWQRANHLPPGSYGGLRNGFPFPRPRQKACCKFHWLASNQQAY